MMSAPLAISRHICETITSTPMLHTHTHAHLSIPPHPGAPTNNHTQPNTEHRPNAQPHGMSAPQMNGSRNWRWYCRPLSPSRHPQACLPLRTVDAKQGTGDVSTSRDQQTHMRNHTIDSHVAHTHTRSPLPSPHPEAPTTHHTQPHQTPAQCPTTRDECTSDAAVPLQLMMVLPSIVTEPVLTYMPPAASCGRDAGHRGCQHLSRSADTYAKLYHRFPCRTHTHTHLSLHPTQKHRPPTTPTPTKHRPNAQPHGKSAHLTKLCRCNW